MILGLLAIPILSVSSAAMLADVASTTDPAAAAVGIPATLGGVVMGALVFRLARVMRSGAVAIRAVITAAHARAERVLTSVSSPISLSSSLRPATVLVPTRVGKRGPPVVLR